MGLGWIIICAALAFFVLKYGFKAARGLYQASERERMRRALDWDNTYRRERNRKRIVSSQPFWRRWGLFD
ncbi:MAG: hypothetical protein AAF700_14085 [Pseudomonadota bacterium]